MRFPEFSGEWTKIKLGDLGSFFSGGTPSSSRKDFYGGEIPFIRSGELHSDSTALSITKEAYDSCSAKMVNKGDLLLALYGATSGDISISRISGAINQAILCIRPQYMDAYFIKSLWEKHKRHILETYLQGGQGNLSSEIIKNISFFFPNSDEQVKISRLIHIIDDRIETQSKIIEELTDLRSALIEKCAKQSGNCISLSDILREVEERSTTANQYQVLSSTVKGIFSQKEYFNKDIASEDNKGYKVVRKGHIVLSPQNLWMGNINYNDRFDIGIVSPSYKVFSIKEGFNPIFIAALLQTKKALNEYMLASEQGASIVRRNLNIEAFMAIKFRIPDARQQDSLSMAITAINAKLNNERCYLEQLTMQKSCLLENMFI